MSGGTFPIKIKVLGYSGYRLNERPLGFVFQERRYQVEDIIDRWYGEDYDYFKVTADDGRIYLIKWHRTDDEWFLDAYSVV